MERITADEKYGYAVSTRRIPEALDRLGEYEDTGLSPEEVALYVKCQASQVSRRELALAAERDRLADEVARLREDARWIPVDERLPEDDKRLHFYDDGRMRFTSVLAVTDRRVYLRNRLMVRKTGSAYLDEQATEGWEWGAGGTVTHWRPLPQGPEVDDAENGEG